MTLGHSLVGTLTLSTILLVEPVSTMQTGQRAEVPAARQDAVAAFDKALADYVRLRDRVTGPIKPVPNVATPTEIDDNQRLARQAIVNARSTARPGTVFLPDIQNYIRARLVEVFRRPDGPAVRASILDENPIGTPVRVNAPYPDGIPLASMPPQLLEALPKLPKDLEYRFVGDRLILFDNHAHLVIDYVDRALPGM